MLNYYYYCNYYYCLERKKEAGLTCKLLIKKLVFVNEKHTEREIVIAPN